MKMLVTGASGFIGRYVVRELLDHGHDVTAIVRRSSEAIFAHPHLKYAVGDIRDRDFIFRITKSIDRVIHVAGLKSDEPDSFDTNVNGMKNICDACIAAGVGGLINAGTMSVKLPTLGLYANTKQEAEFILRESKVSSITLRFSVVYGELDKGVVGSLVRFTRFPFIPVIGSGILSLRPIHVSDASKVIRRASELDLQGYADFDIGGPDRITFNDFAKLIAKVFHNKTARLVHIPLWTGLLIARISSFMKRPILTVSNVIAMNEDAPLRQNSFVESLGVRPRSIEQGLREMKDSAQMTQRESWLIMRYVCDSAPNSALVERYEQVLISNQLRIRAQANFFVRGKHRLQALDMLTKRMYPHCELQKKLGAAIALFECSPASASILLPRRRKFIDPILMGFRTAWELFCAAPFIIFLIARPKQLKSYAF